MEEPFPPWAPQVPGPWCQPGGPTTTPEPTEATVEKNEPMENMDRTDPHLPHLVRAVWVGWVGGPRASPFTPFPSSMMPRFGHAYQQGHTGNPNIPHTGTRAGPGSHPPHPYLPRETIPPPPPPQGPIPLPRAPPPPPAHYCLVGSHRTWPCVFPLYSSGGGL